MGIDKADVEGIIHLNLPSSPEHYLQEIGRAGRDGRQAKAIAIPSLDEIPIRHSLVHSNFLSKSQIRALIFALKRAVVQCEVEENPVSCNVALPVDDTVIECDGKVETIETLLSILEQHGGDNPLFHVEGFNYDRATIALKKRSLDKLAETAPVASSIQRVGTCFKMTTEQDDETATYSQQQPSFQRHFLAYGRGSYSFSVAKCANALGPSAECRHVFAALRRLQACGEIELVLDTSPKGRVLLLKLSREGSSFFHSDDFDMQAEHIVDILHESFSSSIFSAATKVLDMSYILDSMANAGTTEPDETSGPSAGKSPSLLRFQELARDYFRKGLLPVVHDMTETESRRILANSFFSVDRRELESDLFALLQDLPVLTKKVPDFDFAPIFGKSNFGDYTVVAAAKFLHGLDSARAPVTAFRGHGLFGKWKQTHFRYLLDAIEKLVRSTDSKGDV
jgi:ATP-dependent DNA helicase Q4